ncbi:MAG: lysophospholipid acyltransferase family protein [Pseudomonadales bacterium]|nr:lysophospholipid acyltransferase family protein [Pseudomonadales bacterium]
MADKDSSKNDIKKDITGKVMANSLRLIGKLPFAAIHSLGISAGQLLWALNTDTRRITQINIDQCFKDESKSWRRQLAKKSLIETAKTGLEMGGVWTKSVDVPLNKIHAVEGANLIEEARKDGKGVIILAPHLGNWEILGNWLCQRYPITNLYQPPEHEAMHDLIYHARTRSGAKLAPTNRRGVVQLVRALRNGELTGILPDQEPERHSGSEFVPFFGNEALTATIIPKLVKESNAVAIGGFCLRDGDGYKVIFRTVDQGIYSDDLKTATACMNASIESYVRECPEQYQWEYKRFKRRPKGMESFYNPGRITRKPLVR